MRFRVFDPVDKIYLPDMYGKLACADFVVDNVGYPYIRTRARDGKGDIFIRTNDFILEYSSGLYDV